MVLDMFGTFVRPLEIELGMKSNHRVGRFSDVSKSKEYHDRIEAINFSLAHDDGQSNRDLEQADVILVGVSRSGKTPTSLYLAMQHGLKAANYPLIPEDFDRRQLPPALVPHRKKIFGLTIQPERLSEIRNERRPNSRYAALENCRTRWRGRGDDAARRHPLALDHHQVDRRDRHHHPAGAPARAAADQVVERAERRLRAFTGRDDDLLERHGRHVARREHAGHRGLALGVDDDLAVLRQLDHALEPVGVGHQADLDEHAFELHGFQLAAARSL
jgi:hypothetical protein